MTLIDYAKYLLNVCGRRFTHLYRRHYLDSTPALPSLSALLSYIKTQTASIYAHLLSRGCTQSTPTFANLLPTIHQLDTRKVEVGTSTTIADGEGLVRLVCDTTKCTLVTELIDTDTSEWTMDNTILSSIFSKIKKLKLNTHTFKALVMIPSTFTELEEVELNNLHYFYSYKTYSGNATVSIIIGTKVQVLNLPELIFGALHSQSVFNYDYCSIAASCNYLKKIYAPKLQTFANRNAASGIVQNCPLLEELILPSYTENFPNMSLYNCPSLIKIEIIRNRITDVNLQHWIPTNVLSDETKIATFLSNFQTYILDRLQVGANKTLTVSSAVYSAVSGLTMPSGWTLAQA